MITSIFLVKNYNSRSASVAGVAGYDPLRGSVMEGVAKEASTLKANEVSTAVDAGATPTKLA